MTSRSRTLRAEWNEAPSHSMPSTYLFSSSGWTTARSILYPENPTCVSTRWPRRSSAVCTCTSNSESNIRPAACAPPLPRADIDGLIDDMTAFCASRSAEPVARAYSRNCRRRSGPSFFGVGRTSVGSIDETTTISWRALVTATLSLFSPPRALRVPNRLANLPSASLAYPIENTITSRSSPCTFSMFFTNSPSSRPADSWAAACSSAKAASSSSLRSSRSITSSCCASLKVMTPTDRYGAPLSRERSHSAATSSRTLSASTRFFLFSHVPLHRTQRMGGCSGSEAAFGATLSMPA